MQRFAPALAAAGSALLFAAVALAVMTAAGPARAAWEVTETPGEEGGSTLAAEVFSQSGAGRLAVGCTPEDVLYVGIEYVGHVTAADELRVAYRVDGRGSIQGRWPTAPADGALRVYNTTGIYVDEMVRRLRRGRWLAVEIELLPRLRFDLMGSDDAISLIMQRCGGETVPPVVEPGEEGEASEDGEDTEDAAPDGGGGGAGEPTPLVPTD
jgi:hypothetical protein